MKVLFINETCGTGSIGRLTKELAESFEERGHECLYAFSNGRADFHHSYLIGTPQDHKAHAILSRITGLQGYFSNHATRKLLREIDAYKPDIVQLCNLHSNYVNLRLLYGHLAKNDIPTVMVLHDCWFFTGKCTHPVMTQCQRWKSGCGRCPQLHRDNVNPTYFFDTTRKCIADKHRWYEKLPRLAVVGVSDWVTGQAKESVLKERKLTTIYNWTDGEVFRPRPGSVREKYGIGSKFFVLMVTSYICEKKGYRELLGIAEHADENMAVVVVGKNKYNKPIPENVILIDHTDHVVELAEIYSAADVCVNTTRYETFGMVTVESMCCGTPVVIYNNTASPELVGDRCGIIVEESAGIKGIMAALREVRTNGKAYYSKTCVVSANARFNREKSVGEYESLFQSLIDQQTNHMDSSR